MVPPPHLSGCATRETPYWRRNVVQKYNMPTNLNFLEKNCRKNLLESIAKQNRMKHKPEPNPQTRANKDVQPGQEPILKQV